MSPRRSVHRAASPLPRVRDGGTVLMPLADQFWGAKFGMVKDRHGIHWMFNFEKPR